MHPDALAHLQLLHLADTSFPIGAVAHSFGLETLVSEGLLTVNDLEPFFQGYLAETGVLEGAFCHAAFRLGAAPAATFEHDWTTINAELSAFKVARESRAASATLGRRFLRLVLDLEPNPLLQRAVDSAQASSTDIHTATAFGLVGAALHLDEATTVATFLQQSLMTMVSACQRLLPLGQVRASQILWRLKPAILAAAAASRAEHPLESATFSFTPLLDLGGMRHATLSPRLFVS